MLMFRIANAVRVRILCKVETIISFLRGGVPNKLYTNLRKEGIFNFSMKSLLGGGKANSEQQKVVANEVGLRGFH